jgi:hypothetical protein
MKTLYFIGLFLVLSTFRAQPSFQWAGTYGGSSGHDISLSMTVDTAGNVYSAGYFWGISDFDPGLGTYTLASVTPSYDIFVSAIDANANFKWAKRIGGTRSDGGYAICCDHTGNIFLAGGFSGVVDFDPGPGTFTMATPSPTASGGFVLKLDMNGNFLWAIQFGASLFRSITIDQSGNILLVGPFMGVVDFDPGPGVFTMTATPMQNAFLLKLDPGANFLWANQINSGYNCAVKTDPAGNVYTCGSFSVTTDFDPGPGTFTLSPHGGRDGYVVKYHSSGGLVWAKKLGGSGDEWVYDLGVDCEGNVVSAGYFNGNLYANPALNLVTFMTLGSSDAFVSKLDQNGSHVWSKRYGGQYSEIALQLCLDRAGDIYLTGTFGGNLASSTYTADFDPGPMATTYTSVGKDDLYYSKLLANGNFAWAYTSGSPGDEGGFDICVSDDFEVWISSEFSFGSTVDYDPFIPVYNLTSIGMIDMVLVSLSQANPLTPSFTSASGLNVCFGSAASITAQGSGNLSWFPDSTSTLILGTGSTYTLPAVTTNTTLYVSSSVCGTTSVRVPASVTVMPLPLVTANASSTFICEGSPVTLAASGASTYIWSNSQTGAVVTVTPAGSTIYTVTGTAANSCTADALILVQVSKCLSVQESDWIESGLTVFPNPATDAFTVKSDVPLRFTLVNALGEVLMSVDSRESVLEFDAGLPPGIYFIIPADALHSAQHLVVNGE